MLSQDIDEKLFAKKVEVAVDEMCGCIGIAPLRETACRSAQSLEWKARQMRKVDGNSSALADSVRDKEFIVGHTGRQV
jgi:glutathione S-transferase